MVIARKGIISKNAKQFRDSGTKCETVRELVRRQISLSNLHTRNLQTGVLHPSEGRDKEKEREGGGRSARQVFFCVLLSVLYLALNLVAEAESRLSPSTVIKRGGGY